MAGGKDLTLMRVRVMDELNVKILLSAVAFAPVMFFLRHCITTLPVVVVVVSRPTPLHALNEYPE